MDLIQRRLAQLSQLDVELSVEGAAVHGYKVRESVTKRQIRGFEKLVGCKLPEDFFNFIVMVGNGAPGREGVVYPLPVGHEDFSLGDWYMSEVALGQKFLPGELLSPGDGFRRPAWAGALPLVEVGGQYKYWLIVSAGSEFGSVWEVNAAGKLVPVFSELHGRYSFGEWYLKWLDDSIGFVSAGLGANA